MQDLKKKKEIYSKIIQIHQNELQKKVLWSIKSTFKIFIFFKYELEAMQIYDAAVKLWAIYVYNVECSLAKECIHAGSYFLSVAGWKGGGNPYSISLQDVGFKVNYWCLSNSVHYTKALQLYSNNKLFRWRVIFCFKIDFKIFMDSLISRTTGQSGSDCHRIRHH